MLPNNHVTRKISAPLLFISFNLFFYKNNSKNKRKKEEWQKLPDFIRNFLFQTFLKITFSAKNKVQKKRIGRFAPETFITGMSYNKGRYPPSAKQKCCGSPPPPPKIQMTPPRSASQPRSVKKILHENRFFRSFQASRLRRGVAKRKACWKRFTKKNRKMLNQSSLLFRKRSSANI